MISRTVRWIFLTFLKRWTRELHTWYITEDEYPRLSKYYLLHLRIEVDSGKHCVQPVTPSDEYTRVSFRLKTAIASPSSSFRELIPDKLIKRMSTGNDSFSHIPLRGTGCNSLPFVARCKCRLAKDPELYDLPGVLGMLYAQTVDEDPDKTGDAGSSTSLLTEKAEEC